MISAKIENATRGIIRDVQQMRAQKLTGLHLLWNNPLCCFLEYVLKEESKKVANLLIKYFQQHDAENGESTPSASIFAHFLV